MALLSIGCQKALAKPATLDGLLPDQIEGSARLRPGIPGIRQNPNHAHGIYWLRGPRRAVSINLNLHGDKSGGSARPRLAPGETREDPLGEGKGFEVSGHRGERWAYRRNGQSTASLLLGERLEIDVTVQPTQDPDESIRYLKTLDLRSIEAFAKVARPVEPLRWPAKAWLRTEGGDQIIYDEPARTEEELRRRMRSHEVRLSWPAARGPVKEYRVSKDGRVLVTVGASTLHWKSVVVDPEGLYEVVAGDGAGQWSAPLEGRWRRGPTPGEAAPEGEASGAVGGSTKP
jgi:hypothetical protein